MKKLIFILGASGSGKTTSVQTIETMYPDTYFFAYFDQPNVPSEQEVLEEYGNWENWGIQRTHTWLSTITNEYIQNKVTIFDVQTKPDTIKKTCIEYGINDYHVVLLDCSDEIRRKRLIERNQAHLISDSLFTWAQYLRDEAKKKNYTIIDNTNLFINESVKQIEEKIIELCK